MKVCLVRIPLIEHGRSLIRSSGRGTAAYSHSQSLAKKAQDFLPFHQRNRRMTDVVEYVLCGHRCPGRDEPYSNDAISLIRHKIMQRDVEIKVETVCRTGTFIGSLWESITNVGAILLEVGLAKLQTRSGKDDSPACDVPGFENNKMTFMRHVSFVDFQVRITPITVITIWEYMDTEI
ncbi:ribonuclease TUDOR 1-like protein [Tanacetum coccineum]